ncbi:alpha/beta fold hydrolase [Skermania sp. ID1734]|uniref:alpha/beta fold hydrolase n=1 Tax=Skermania sp. ID1734 TaxID=2597516 RepID=UPI001180AEC3|nr:alpha/beta fold hydrolase [Skermania sp. ID1734]TSD99195.1 alpha/beta fold hydrolase [Skermania sp. ID1734]
MPAPTEELSTLDRVRREIERNALRARNGIKLAAGISRPKYGQSPKDVVWTFGRAELWHYRNDAVKFSPPLLIVPSLVSRSYIIDLAPGNSLIEVLVRTGFDVYMLDWGAPDERDAANRFEDYVDLAIPAAIRQIQRRSKADEVNLFGYCFGGVLTLMHAAHNQKSPIRSLTVLACPVDFSQLGSLVDVIGRTEMDVDKVVGDDGNIPARVILQSFRSLAPMGDITNYVNLLDRMWNDEFVTAHQLMNGWATDHIPFPGATARQAANMLVRDNAFMTGRLELGGDRVSLSDITAPFLAVLGTRDTVIPEPASAPVMDLVGSAQKEVLRMQGGHVGLIVGRSAHRVTIPKLIEFLQQRSEPLS